MPNVPPRPPQRLSVTKQHRHPSVTSKHDRTSIADGPESFVSSLGILVIVASSLLAVLLIGGLIALLLQQARQESNQLARDDYRELLSTNDSNDVDSRIDKSDLDESIENSEIEPTIGKDSSEASIGSDGIDAMQPTEELSETLVTSDKRQQDRPVESEPPPAHTSISTWSILANSSRIIERPAKGVVSDFEIFGLNTFEDNDLQFASTKYDSSTRKLDIRLGAPSRATVATLEQTDPTKVVFAWADEQSLGKQKQLFQRAREALRWCVLGIQYETGERELLQLSEPIRIKSLELDKSGRIDFDNFDLQGASFFQKLQVAKPPISSIEQNRMFSEEDIPLDDSSKDSFSRVYYWSDDSLGPNTKEQILRFRYSLRRETTGLRLQRSLEYRLPIGIVPREAVIKTWENGSKNSLKQLKYLADELRPTITRFGSSRSDLDSLVEIVEDFLNSPFELTQFSLAIPYDMNGDELEKWKKWTDNMPWSGKASALVFVVGEARE